MAGDDRGVSFDEPAVAPGLRHITLDRVRRERNHRTTALHPNALNNEISRRKKRTLRSTTVSDPSAEDVRLDEIVTKIQNSTIPITRSKSATQRRDLQQLQQQMDAAGPSHHGNNNRRSSEGSEAHRSRRCSTVRYALRRLKSMLH